MSAQGWSAATTLGTIHKRHQTLKGLFPANPFRVETKFEIYDPRVGATLQPWAEIRERLRR
jgi:hypothetical protein